MTTREVRGEKWPFPYLMKSGIHFLNFLDPPESSICSCIGLSVHGALSFPSHCISYSILKCSLCGLLTPENRFYLIGCVEAWPVEQPEHFSCLGPGSSLTSKLERTDPEHGDLWHSFLPIPPLLSLHQQAGRRSPAPCVHLAFCSGSCRARSPRFRDWREEG